jgi:hypothetical protein
MKFVTIDPRTTKVSFVDAANLNEAKIAVGLDPDQVDHGTIWHDFRYGGISIVVYEFGLYLPRDTDRYFAIGRSLYVGPAVLYGFDAAGETVDLVEPPPVSFFPNADAVERAIEAGQIIRPVMAINGEVLWKWPDPPADPEIATRMRGRAR